MRSARAPARRARTSLALVSAALFGLVTWRAAHSVEPDYALHAGWAHQLAETGVIDVPHPLFHILTVVVRALLPLRLADLVRPGLASEWAAQSDLFAAVLVGTGAWVALALVLQRRFLASDRRETTPSRAWAAACWALALLLLGPITLFTWPQHQLYLGYIAPNVFHNPTMALLKPLAVAWFWAVTQEEPGGSGRWLGAGLLACAATLAKPSFTVAFLPALLLWLLLAPWLPRAVDRSAATSSLVAGGSVLAFQAWTRGSQPSLLSLAPLEVVGFYSARWQMPLLLLLSLAFPLCASLARRRTARRDGPLLLAWLVFAVAAAYGYLLAEAEPNSGDGNWLWSGQVALFVLLAQCVLFVRSRTHAETPPATRARRLCALFFALQLACGVAWYAAEVLQPHQWWFPFAESDE